MLFRSFASKLVPCLRWGPLSVCAVAELGAINAKADPTSAPWWHTAFVLAGGGRLAFEIPVNARLALRAYGEVLADLQPVTLELDRMAAWSAARIDAVAGLGTVAYFP